LAYISGWWRRLISNLIGASLPRDKKEFSSDVAAVKDASHP
jgi:hypothetical protein